MALTIYHILYSNKRFQMSPPRKLIKLLTMCSIVPLKITIYQVTTIQ